jgi:phosphate acyltransferase
MRIALDAMGGDFAPQINVQGAIDALCANLDLEISLVGDASDLQRRLAETGYSGERLSIVPSDGCIGMEEKPTDALRKKPRCSIAVCWRLMASREVDAVISAGNTGGVVAAGLWSRLFLKGVRRPGIAVVLPTLTGRTVLMDVGANPDAKPEHLYQYAVMAQIYSREMLGISHPRVGLMNIGSEDGKGNELVRGTHQLLTKSPYKMDYVGNVEGRGLYLGEADVVICEGFVGNVVLKVSEGMASMFMRRIPHAVLKALHSEKHLAAAAFENLAHSYEYNETGGAPLLGIDGVCIICHGSSDARSVANALQGAAALHKRNVNAQITAALSLSE